MKTAMRLILIALVTAGMASVQPARAQTGSHTHGFTPLPEVTVTGTVELVRDNGLEGCELCEACSDCGAVHVLLRTRTGRMEVHLAPVWFLARLDCAPATGDVMSVIGSRTHVPKGRGIAARGVHVGRTVFTLRDEHGLPLWRHTLTDTRESSHDTIGR